MDDLLSEFLTETSEGLSTLDVEIVKLEQNPNDADLLGNIFRLMHTIKGTCGFLGLPRLESVAHAGENILGKVRDGELVVTGPIVSLILECLDQIRDILNALEATEAEPEGDDSELISRLNAAAEGNMADAPAEAAAPAAAPAEAAPAAAEPEAEAEEEFVPTPASETGNMNVMAEEPQAEAVAEEPAAEAAPEPVAETPAPAAPEAPAAAPPAPAAAAKKPAGNQEVAKESSVANQSIRVNVDLLENLMTMVSELVLTRNQTLQILRGQKDSEFAAPLQRLNHVVSELQEGVMKTRMQPIGNAWAKLPRIIRDLSLELDKKIDLVMKGAETELDRQVLELIKDPLTHMVRNSADHGLEMPEDRIKVGKPETGKVLLNAFHEGGHIIIEIVDDGRGLASAKIKEKVLANGLATEAELESMSEQQIQQFIFKAGFSTAAAVTSVSGRGVGMDVVRTNIEKIGGTVELKSVEGKGTTFTIKIPLTLAIVSALIVACGRERFAIPQLSVVELVRASGNSEHSIERINDTPVLRLRNRLLPLVNLRELLKLPPQEAEGPVGSESDEASETAEHAEMADAESKSPEDTTGLIKNDNFIVVAQVGTYSFGIIVDRVFDTEEIVVKPVAPILRDIQLFSGNTILGDGAVVMILDPNGIAAATGEIAVSGSAAEGAAERHAGNNAETVAMLVFRAADEAPKAVPLGLVARLEEIDLASVENSGGQRVVQYRGALMPLVQMDGKELKSEGRQPVLVFSDRDRTMGLVVDEIVDIVEDRMNIELGTEKQGCIGSAIIDDKATDIIDASFYLQQAFSDWFAGGERGDGAEEGGSKILVVDDSPFFRNLLAPLLSVAGYEVTTVESAAEALELCEAGKVFDVIVSDIEMPGMSGFEFAETVKNNTRWANVPLVALSSFASPNDLARGREVGFTDYVSKNDRDALLHTLKDTLAEVRGAA
ncbi:chemotaxis protein CheW [Denitrobaculum tricleocarpae]|uniref:Chemotaxis protein CheA n=1 Tax=Denitrobaculum tricleocarpae TaxID=2591009 RepID=A0A545T3V4_9PROT|nr:chemotaxis protein CheW [Denitrobaculum tricleocarpae]TQV71901.1 hybrid sensor histidine kinase/response regulator [Denitrobaculum tricleocarpae]